MEEELTEEETAELVEDLRGLQRELGGQLSTGADGVRPVELDQPIGRLTRMDAIQQQKMAQASRRNVERRARQVTTALNAAAEGEYGLCRRCEEPVGYARLKVRPESPFCIACQGQAERRRRGGA